VESERQKIGYDLQVELVDDGLTLVVVNVDVGVG